MLRHPKEPITIVLEAQPPILPITIQLSFTLTHENLNICLPITIGVETALTPKIRFSRYSDPEMPGLDVTLTPSDHR